MTVESLKRLPFDYYGRYRLAAETVESVTGPGACVLDVGGGPGALTAFLEDRTVVSCDLRVEEDPRVAATTLVLADGGLLPFADGTFDVVVSLDTLEHVPPHNRRAVLREASRVARGWVLIVCPCATDGVAEADAALLSYVRQRFGEEFASVPVLTEHLAYGHPDPDDVLAELRATGGEVATFPSGRLDRWLPMMLLFYDLMALGRDDPVERVQAWYNPRYWRDDLRAPAYRQAFLLRLPGAGGPPPASVADGLLPPAEQEATDVAGFEALRLAFQGAAPGRGPGAAGTGAPPRRGAVRGGAAPGRAGRAPGGRRRSGRGAAGLPRPGALAPGGAVPQRLAPPPLGARRQPRALPIPHGRC